MIASPVTTEVAGDLEEIAMFNPELTQALAEDHIRELQRRAAHHLPVSPATARFQGLSALAGAFTHHRRTRTAAPATAAPLPDAPPTGSPVGCAA